MMQLTTEEIEKWFSELAPEQKFQVWALLAPIIEQANKNCRHKTVKKSPDKKFEYCNSCNSKWDLVSEKEKQLKKLEEKFKDI